MSISKLSGKKQRGGLRASTTICARRRCSSCIRPQCLRALLSTASRQRKKWAKAVLVAGSLEPPKIHDVAKLGRLVNARHEEIGRSIADLGGLTAWYISARYPDSEIDPILSLDEIQGALAKLKGVRATIDALAPKPR